MSYSSYWLTSLKWLASLKLFTEYLLALRTYPDMTTSCWPPMVEHTINNARCLYSTNSDWDIKDTNTFFFSENNFNNNKGLSSKGHLFCDWSTLKTLKAQFHFVPSGCCCDFVKNITVPLGVLSNPQKLHTSLTLSSHAHTHACAHTYSFMCLSR